MSMIQSDLLLGQEGGAGYTISRSLRFNSSDSAYLSRVTASAGNRRVYTWSGWVKRNALSSTLTYYLFSAQEGANANNVDIIGFEGDNLYWYNAFSGSVDSQAELRDPSAWYHILVAVDTTQATNTNRVKLYVNGSEIAYRNQLYPSLNRDLATNSNNTTHQIGRYTTASDSNFCLADIHFIDGQALDPLSFVETSATTGQLIPKAYTGSYGTNGFRLDFSDNSAATATTLGKDRAGSNNWTPNNLSVTAGVGNDSLVDTPTSGSQVDTGLGGQVTGNYCTLNPLANPGSSTLSNGNLDVVTASASYGKVNGTIAVSSGKWYWEVVCTVKNQDAFIGIEGVANANSDTYTGGSATGTGWYDGGSIYSNASSTSYGTTYAVNDVIGVALNMDAGTLVFYKNGVSAGTAKTGLSGSFTASVSDGATSGSGNTYVCNFGQRAFAYTAPSGFKALCDTNLPAPVVAKPNSVFDVALWTGNGSARSITGLNFNPDFVWIKGRSGATDHALYDAVRGATIDLVSNSTAAETTQTQGLTAFNSDGFSLGTLAKVNTNTATYAGWAWDAGSSTVTNTQGSITSSVRANASAGFSIVTWTPASRGTVGHGLNVAPEFIITKDRDTTNGWLTYHKSLGEQKYLSLNLTSAVTSNSTIFSTAPTSTVFDPGTGVTSGNGYGRQICYCFAPVAGYSAFGSYTGNGSADGPFVYTGFRPRWVMIKNSTSDGGGNSSWLLVDTARGDYNVVNPFLLANTSATEGSVGYLDILSNGFKLRATGDRVNASATYIYAAFAENPFQFARAR